MFGTYEEPVRESDDYKPRDNYGANVILKVTELKEGITTVNGIADAVFADVCDLADGAVYRNVMLMGGAFVDGLKPHVGKAPVVVTWGKRTSTQGRPYAYPQAAAPAVIEAAKAVYAKGDPFAPAVGTVSEEAPF